MRRTLVELGLNIQSAIAGFAGGVVHTFVFKQTGPWAVVGSVVVGALTANYLGEPVSRQFGLNTGASGFIVGLCAMAICQALVQAAKRYKIGTANGKD